MISISISTTRLRRALVVLAAQRGEFDVRFTYARKQGGSGLVFLRESAFNTARGKSTGEDPFPALVEMARKSEQPVFLVPELFVWEKWLQKITPSVFDRIFGGNGLPTLCLGGIHLVLHRLFSMESKSFQCGRIVCQKPPKTRFSAARWFRESA